MKSFDVMERNDISLATEHGRFNYRVGAIIVYDGHLLMVKNANFPYYYSVGGRVQFDETSAEAVLREVHEETRIKMEIERLAYVHENFFTWEIGNQPCHEIAFFYNVKPADNRSLAALQCRSHGDDGGAESLFWLPLDRLSDYDLYPEFFKTEAQNLGKEFGHYITRDETTCRVI